MMTMEKQNDQIKNYHTSKDRATALIRDVATFGYLHSISSIIAQMNFCSVTTHLPESLQMALMAAREEITKYSHERINNLNIIDELKGELGKTVFGDKE